MCVKPLLYTSKKIKSKQYSPLPHIPSVKYFVWLYWKVFSHKGVSSTKTQSVLLVKWKSSLEYWKTGLGLRLCYSYFHYYCFFLFFNHNVLTFNTEKLSFFLILNLWSVVMWDKLELLEDSWNKMFYLLQYETQQ